MSHTQNNVRDAVHHSMTDLTALRDDIKVRLHLAGMEAKDMWNTKLEPEINHIEEQMKAAAELPKELVDGLVAKLKSFRDGLQKSH